MSDLKRNVDRAVRCPQLHCRSSLVELTEIGTHIVLRYRRQPDGSMQRVQIEKRMIDSHVEGHCKVCDNTWKVRGVEHLSELKYHFPADPGVGKTHRRLRTPRALAKTPPVDRSEGRTSVPKRPGRTRTEPD